MKKRFEYMAAVLPATRLSDTRVIDLLNYFGRDGWKKASWDTEGAQRICLLLEREIQELQQDSQSSFGFEPPKYPSVVQVTFENGEIHFG